MSLTLKELAALGGEELLALARRGEIRPRHLWVAAKGAEKYRAAIAAGDIAPEVTQELRASVCAGCTAAPVTFTKVVGGGMDGVEKGWCGRALEEHQDSGACGCLVVLRVKGQTTANGVIVPGAKVAVGSERCPLGEW